MADLPSRELCFALFLTFSARSFCFKPVIIVHGILDHASDMKDLASFITQAHPGTNITLIKLFEELDSFKPMWMQVSAISEKVREVMQEAKDGVHIIGFSQGNGLFLNYSFESISTQVVTLFKDRTLSSAMLVIKWIFLQLFRTLLIRLKDMLGNQTALTYSKDTRIGS